MRGTSAGRGSCRGGWQGGSTRASPSQSPSARAIVSRSRQGFVRRCGMTENLQKEQFSRAYVRAVAAAAAVNTYTPEVDDDSVDMGFSARVVQGQVLRPKVEA